MLKISFVAVVAGLLAACAGEPYDRFSQVAVVEGQSPPYPVGYYADTAHAKVYVRQLSPATETVTERETITR